MVPVTLERVRLQREQETMLMTLYLHALDARSPYPILGDPYAGPLLERIDYDFSRLDKLAGNLPVIVSRAKAIDDVVKSFLVAHPDAVVLHLGCGLDSRVLRIDPGPGVRWFELDQQPVMELRRRLVPERDGASWIPVGAAWPHKDGDGYNIRFDITIRPDTRLVLRKADARPDAGAATEG